MERSRRSSNQPLKRNHHDDEEAFERYGDVPLHFSHYYNFVFVYKSKELDNGNRIYLELGGTMEKVSAMSVDV